MPEDIVLHCTKSVIAVTASVMTYKLHSRCLFFFISVFLKHCHSIPNQTEGKCLSLTEAVVSQNQLQFLLLNALTRLVLYHLLLSSQSKASSTRSIALSGHTKGKRSFFCISSEIPCQIFILLIAGNSRGKEKKNNAHPPQKCKNTPPPFIPVKKSCLLPTQASTKGTRPKQDLASSFTVC